MHSENRFLDTFRGHNIRPILLFCLCARTNSPSGKQALFIHEWRLNTFYFYAAFIRGQPLFEGGVYYRKYGNHVSRNIPKFD